MVNTTRTLRFEPGLNAIVGSMSGGKTATVSCLRALLGAEVSSVSGFVLLDNIPRHAPPGVDHNAPTLGPLAYLHGI